MAKIRLKFVNDFKDRHGKPRFYFRRPGFASVALPGLPGSVAFMQAYQAALDKVPGADIGASRTVSGTFNALIVAYYKHTAFTDDLALATQKMRRAIIEKFRADYGERRITHLQRVHVEKLLSGKKPHAQKNWLKAIRPLMGFAVSQNMCAANPTDGVKPTKARKSLGHMTWHDEQITMYRAHHPLGSMARLALELLLNIAARRGDAHWLGRQHISKGRLCWTPGKTKRTSGKSLQVGIMPELQAALDAMQSKAELTFMLQDYGKPFASAASFGNKFADWCVAAGLKPVLCADGKTRNYRAHGLRKAALRAMAHAGCSGSEMKAVSGHTSMAQLEEYLKEVDDVWLADTAMNKRQAAGIKTETQFYKPYDSKLQTGR
jgi:integrase/recombinase XerD